MSGVRFTVAVCALLVWLAACHMESTGPQPQPQPQQAQTYGSEPPPQQTIIVQQQPAAQPQPVAHGVMQPQPTAQGVTHQQPVAQGVAPSQYTTSNFGTVSLSAGFLPDPHVVRGTSGGSQDSNRWASHCRGSVSTTPDHLLVASTHINSLRIIASSAGDTTLVVRRPDGTFMCNDDADGTNPIVSGSFPTGTYAIWVGSYSQGENLAYQLGFTEMSHVNAASIGGGGNSGSPAVVGGFNTGNPNFGTVSLTPGFMPDPHVASGVSGGAINVQQIRSDCRGWISQSPDHHFVANGHFRSLRILARSGSDTTLVVADQGGNVWCNDDGGSGTNPMITGSFAPGTYRVWVGSYRQGENARYSLGFSELSSVTTFSLPSP